MTTRVRHFLALAAGALVATGAPAAELKKLTYLPHWVPQAQFAGFYVAEDQGFYTQRGLDVTILRGGPGRPPLETMAAGEADIASTFLASALEKRDQGMPVINIAQLVRRSALLLVARKDSGISTPADFHGRPITLWAEFKHQPLALFRKFGVQPRLLPQRNTLNLFLRGGADVTSAMWYNEYHLLLNSGLDEDELVVFHFDAYGLNFPEDGLYVMEPALRRDPEAFRAFVAATLEGWRYAFEHPEEALDSVMRRVLEANLPKTRIHHRWMLHVMKDILQPEGAQGRMGFLAEDEFLTVAREMQTDGQIREIPAYTSFYENLAE